MFSIALAQDWDYLDEEQSVLDPVNPLDPKLPQAYASFDFYETVDPSQWDWTLVDWNLVDLNRADLYDYPGFYDNMPANVYQQIDYNQVDYNLVNQEKIDSDKYLLDKGCTDCDFDPMESRAGRGFLFSSEGIEHPSTGTYVTLSKYPDSIFIYVDEELGMIVDLSRSLYDSSLDLTIKEPVTIEIDELVLQEDYYEPEEGNEGEDYKNYLTINGIKILDGSISIDKSGQTYLTPNAALFTEFQKDPSSKPDDLVIIAPSDHKIPIYTDGKEHDDASYVSLGKGTVIALHSTPPIFPESMLKLDFLNLNAHTIIKDSALKYEFELSCKYWNFHLVTLHHRVSINSATRRRTILEYFKN